jgi:hypothetical protein
LGRTLFKNSSEDLFWFAGARLFANGRSPAISSCSTAIWRTARAALTEALFSWDSFSGRSSFSAIASSRSAKRILNARSRGGYARCVSIKNRRWYHENK